MLFLILALLLISAVPVDVQPWITSEWSAWIASVLIYLVLCVIIYLQQFTFKGIFKKRPGIMPIIVHVELLIYLIIYQYVLNAGRIFQLIPYMQNVQSVNAIWELLLYLGGLAVYFGATYIPLYTHKKRERRVNYTFRQLLFIIPFVIPFILITLALDIFNAIVGPQSNTELLEWFSVIFSLVLILLLLIFLPYFMQKIWLCKPLEEGELKNRLLKICQQANFRHAGMKTWTIMHDQLTAGIIGIVPRFRYIMFTDRILRKLPPENLEAILVHEIGHNKHRHLLLYPFILAGMLLCAAFVFYWIADPLTNFLEQENAIHPSLLWDFFNPFIIFSLYAGVIILYFRFVFGFFSRLFERQADLHIFDLKIPSQHMIQALEAVAHTSGGYDTPNWHHYSIKQRVDFLKACENDPGLIGAHHQKVKMILFCYFVLFITLLIFLIA